MCSRKASYIGSIESIEGQSTFASSQGTPSVNCNEVTQSARENLQAATSNQQQQRNQGRSNGKHRTNGGAVLKVDKLLHPQKPKMFSSDLCSHPLEGLMPMEFERSVSSTQPSIIKALQSQEVLHFRAGELRSFQVSKQWIASAVRTLR